MKYLIFIILFISIFVFSWIQLRNSAFKNLVKIITSGIVAVLLAPLLFWGISKIFSHTKIFSDQKSFDAMVWQENPEARQKMSNDIITNQTFKGFKKTDVLNALGNPDVKTDSVWVYYIEYKKGFFYSLKRLHFKFENDSLNEVNFEDD